MSISQAREVNSQAPSFLVPAAGQVRFRENSELCMQRSLCNAIQLVCFPYVAKHYWNYFNGLQLSFTGDGPAPRRIRDLRDLKKHLDSRQMILHPLRNTVPSLSYLLSLHSGTYVVSHHATKSIRHNISVSLSSILMIVSMEEYPLRLSSESIRSCTGDVSSFLGISEMSRVEVLSLRSKKRRNRTRDNTKKRRKNAGAIRESRSSGHRVTAIGINHH